MVEEITLQMARAALQDDERYLERLCPLTESYLKPRIRKLLFYVGCGLEPTPQRRIVNEHYYRLTCEDIAKEEARYDILDGYEKHVQTNFKWFEMIYGTDPSKYGTERKHIVFEVIIFLMNHLTVVFSTAKVYPHKDSGNYIVNMDEYFGYYWEVYQQPFVRLREVSDLVKQMQPLVTPRFNYFLLKGLKLYKLLCIGYCNGKFEPRSLVHLSRTVVRRKVRQEVESTRKERYHLSFYHLFRKRIDRRTNEPYIWPIPAEVRGILYIWERLKLTPEEVKERFGWDWKTEAILDISN